MYRFKTFLQFSEPNISLAENIKTPGLHPENIVLGILVVFLSVLPLVIRVMLAPSLNFQEQVSFEVSPPLPKNQNLHLNLI